MKRNFFFSEDECFNERTGKKSERKLHKVEKIFTITPCVFVFETIIENRGRRKNKQTKDEI